MRTVAITIVIKMQFIVFCSVITVKHQYRINVNSSSLVILGTFSEWIYTSIRQRTTRNIVVLANLSQSALCALCLLLIPPLDAFFQWQYLCYVRIRDLSLIVKLAYSDQYFKSHLCF